MRPFGANAGAVALSGAVLLLGGWFVYSLVTESGSDGARLDAAPGPEPELIGVSLAGPTASTETPHAGVVPLVHQDTRTVSALAHVVAASPVAVRASASGDAPGKPAVEYNRLLDQVFAPDRFTRQAVVGTKPVVDPAVSLAEADGTVPMWANAASSPPSATAVPGSETEAQEALTRSRVQTEKTYREEFTALAAKDAKAFEQQASTVMREDGDDCKKVAMLRVLYDTDRTRALDYFAQAIATLPDRPRPEGVSVPAFAVSYLGKRVANPAVKAVVEQIACSRAANVSPNLQSLAVDALVATATPADLQRYASYPAFQAATATTGNDGSR